MLSAVDRLWLAMDRSSRKNLLPRFAEALTRAAGLLEVNYRIRKGGFKFENGGLVARPSTPLVPGGRNAR
jgi:hypothetical protein